MSRSRRKVRGQAQRRINSCAVSSRVAISSRTATYEDEMQLELATMALAQVVACCRDHPVALGALDGLLSPLNTLSKPARLGPAEVGCGVPNEA
jgi:hypothetical protein